MKCGGSTAIYKAVHVGCEMLQEWRAAHPEADLRVLCLSDGQNNCHEVTAKDALQALYDVGAVCDCLLVGNSPDQVEHAPVAVKPGPHGDISVAERCTLLVMGKYGGIKWGRTVRCARAVRKVGCSPPPGVR